MTLEIFALRHAATSWNLEKRLQGQQDIPLSEEGIKSLQSKKIPSRFAHFNWYCSPLLRARQTAELLNIQSYQQEQSLKEMNWGNWEGKRLPELRKRLGEQMRIQEAKGLDLQPPAGESPRQVKQRIMAWLTQHTEGSHIGIMSHKGVLRGLLSEALDWDMKSDCAIKIEWNKGLLFQWSKESGLSLKEYNICLD